jgi:glycosyl transferase family 25
LPSRTDRLKSFVEQIKYLDSYAQKVNGVEHDKPMLGIAQAHINSILIAKQNEWPEVLIMEDDVVFQAKEKTLPYLNEALKNLPEDWDVLLGGVYETRHLTKTNEYWSRTGEFCGLHFYIVNSKAYDKVIEGYDERTHFDRWVNKGGKKLNCYVTNKFIATQSNGMSDNVKKVVDYSDRIKRFSLL